MGQLNYFKSKYLIRPDISIAGITFAVLHFHKTIIQDLESKLTALLLLITVAGSSFNNAIVLLQYNLNRQFIATTLCENRDKPGSCCQGKCYLKKQLQKDQDTGQNGSGRGKEKLDIDWFYETAAELFLVNNGEHNFPDAPGFSKYATLLSQVFHPPGQA